MRGVILKTMNLNRKLQLSILEELKNEYPTLYPVQLLSCYDDNKHFHGNIFYLLEHNLIEGEKHYPREKAHQTPVLYTVKITARGLDFIENDGGLRAILEKITIKLDADDLNEILTTFIDNNKEITPNEKSKIRNFIKSASTDGLKIVYKRLINLALDNPKAVADLFQKLLEQST